MKYTKEELFKLIGELAGYGTSTVTVTYNAAKIYDGFGDYVGMSNDWGYAVSTKCCGLDTTADAQHKDLEEALWMLAQAVVSKFEAVANNRQKLALEAKEKMNKFLEKDKPPTPTTRSPYRD